MTEHEQCEALAQGGFIDVGVEMSIDSLVLYSAKRGA